MNSCLRAVQMVLQNFGSGFATGIRLDGLLDAMRTAAREIPTVRGFRIGRHIAEVLGEEPGKGHAAVLHGATQPQDFAQFIPEIGAFRPGQAAPQFRPASPAAEVEREQGEQREYV